MQLVSGASRTLFRQRPSFSEAAPVKKLQETLDRAFLKRARLLETVHLATLEYNTPQLLTSGYTRLAVSQPAPLGVTQSVNTYSNEGRA